MDMGAIIVWLIVGAIAGWLAGMIVKGGGFEGAEPPCVT